MLRSSTPRWLSAAMAACALAGSTGCQDARGTSQEPVPRSVGGKNVVTAPPISAPAAIAMKSETPSVEPGVSAPPRRGTIATITTTDERILVELTLSEDVRAHALEAGMFFRVRGDSDTSFKGLAQVTEVISPTRAIARQIGLTDRSRPLSTGDRVDEVADLAALAPPDAVENAARSQQLRLDQLDVADRRLFEAVRANYQQSLSEIEARHRQACEELERTHREQLEAAEKAHRLADERRQAESKAGEIATRATLAASVAKALQDEHAASQARLTELVTERDRLRTQVDGLLTQQRDSATRIESLIKAQADAAHAAQVQLRAELETREVLQARLDEAEAKLTGRNPTTATVLTSDPAHPETVLERLARVTKELNLEREQRQRLEARISTIDLELANVRSERERLAQQLTSLQNADQRAQQAETALAEAKQRVQAAEQARDVLELTRLEAERRLYDLSARVLRLTDAAPATVALQARLRESLAASSAGNTQ